MSAKNVLKICLFLFLCFPLSAKDIVFNISRLSYRPVIDGIPDDSAWLGIEPIKGFMQYNPVEGNAPSESTELYIAYDNEYFYLVFKCYDSETDEVRATMTQRESWDNDDCIGFTFDTYNSEQEAFLFNFNPYGVPFDMIYHPDGYIDNGWDSDIRSKGRIFPDFYCIEIAVPFKSLRMPVKKEQEWGFYALRVIRRKGEMVVWPPRTHKIPNLLAQAALLKGIQGVATGRNLAFLPYLFSSYMKNQGEESKSLEAGSDFRYGITSDLLLDITVNPDYSQIEADPDRIELTARYLQMLPEKRPFFTEGTDVFVSNQALFYSRNITNPLAGLKLTGRFAGNRLGFLSAVDDEPGYPAKLYYNHLRVTRKLYPGSSLGLLTTNKDNFEDMTFNRVLSMDGIFTFQEIYYLKAQLTRTFTSDSIRRYDATGYNLYIGRIAERMYNDVWYNDFPDSFATQSGSMWDVIGYREVGTQNELYFRKPSPLINEIILKAGAKGRFNYDNELKDDYFWTGAEVALNKIWSELKLFRNHESYNDLEFRYVGGEVELWNTPAQFIDHYASVYFGGAAHYYLGFTGWKYRVGYNAVMKPIARIVYYLNISREDFYYEYGGERCYLQTIVWNKLSYQIMPAMFIRAIYQYNSLDRNSDVSLLYAFEYLPLSNIYFGINSNNLTSLNQLDDNIEIFAKIGFLWRL